jgi:hypothetical protein
MTRERVARELMSCGAAHLGFMPIVEQAPTPRFPSRCIKLTMPGYVIDVPTAWDGPCLVNFGTALDTCEVNFKVAPQQMLSADSPVGSRLTGAPK